MKRTLRNSLAAVALAGVAVLGIPTAANASIIYPPSGACSVSPTTANAGATVNFSCVAETFSSNETVTITITGENGSTAKVGMVKLALGTASGTATSAADGSLGAVPVTLPSNASGIYNVAAVSASSAGGTASVTIVDPATGLPQTGSDSGPLVALAIGGGVVLLGGIAIAAAAGVRRAQRR